MDARYCIASETSTPALNASASSAAPPSETARLGSDRSAPTPPHASSTTTGEVSISVLAPPQVLTQWVIASHASKHQRAPAGERVRADAQQVHGAEDGGEQRDEDQHVRQRQRAARRRELVAAAQPHAEHLFRAQRRCAGCRSWSSRRSRWRLPATPTGRSTWATPRSAPPARRRRAATPRVAPARRAAVRPRAASRAPLRARTRRRAPTRRRRRRAPTRQRRATSANGIARVAPARSQPRCPTDSAPSVRIIASAVTSLTEPNSSYAYTSAGTTAVSAASAAHGPRRPMRRASSHAGPAASASMNASNGWNAQISDSPSRRALPPNSVSAPDG